MKTEYWSYFRDFRAEDLEIQLVRNEDLNVLSFYNKDICRFEGSINTLNLKIQNMPS